jgi:hypothetical protein
MGPLDDFDIEKEPAPAPPAAYDNGGSGIWTVIVAAIAVLAAAAAYYWYQREPSHQPSQRATQGRPAAAAPAQRGPGEPGEDIPLPPLDESDDLVRQLVRRLSSHPAVAAWLATDGLIRNFTVVTVNIANGGRPEKQLGTLKPAAPFLVRGTEGNQSIDPRSYARYNEYADAISAIDARGAARLYATLKPRIEDAYRELGEPAASFDDVLERAIRELLEVPIVRDPIAVVPKPMSYAFADPKLEALTPPQKHLLRLGSKNVALIQAKLREIAGYLGIPADRLPAPPTI